MIETILSGIISFVGTNIDDMFINTLFFSEADSKEKVRSVIIGKYLGIGTLVLIALLGAFGLSFIPQQYIRMLGIIPIGLGIKEIVASFREKNSDENEEPAQKAAGFVWNVMLVTMANGADNIGVYIPLFAGYRLWQLAIVVGIFAIMTAIWCFLGKKLSDLPILRSLINKYKHIIVPLVYIALGIYIILK